MAGITANIKGYRQLTEEEQHFINTVKTKAEEVGQLVDEVSKISGVDARWLEKAQIDLQVGFMELVRSIAKPTTF